MSESNPAVFLSYASQDAGAAKRICEALRTRNIEVWFDQSELRGGDVWDQKIRQQIRDCALFIPIISANTASRPEGYFRLEWDLADQRTHKMSRSRPFIVPVCLDATTDANADVPDSFLRVQWSRLPAGETPPSFADRVSDLLAAKQPAPAASQASGVSAIASAIARKSAVSSRWKPAALVIAVLALVLGFYVLSQRRAADPVSAQSTPMEKTGSNPGSAISAPVNATAPDAIPLQSIAVLPFVNMSSDKDQEYFSDGLSEELIGQLSRIPDLRVPARTSSFYFKGRSDDIAAIASKLRVAHVLEGSVRKAGNRLRVTAELIRADNGYHLWSETYDRELKDVFKVQTDIASAVVAALRLQLAAVQPVSSQRTQDTEAHNFYLLGRQFSRGTSPDELKRAIDALHKAIALDPSYAGAYAELSVNELNLADSISDEGGFSRARAAAEKAVALAPQQAEGYSARGRLRIVRDWDWAGAQADLDKALALNPIDPTALRRHASLLATQGRLPESIAVLRKAVEIDPLSAQSWQNLGQFLMAHREFAAADEATGRSLEIDPNSFYAQNDRGTLRLHQGKPAEALAVFTKLDDELFRDIGIAMSQHSLGHAAESQKFLAAATAANAQVGAYQIAEVHAWRGESAQALDWLDRAYRQRDGGLAAIKYDELLESLRREPRFRALLRKLKLPE